MHEFMTYKFNIHGGNVPLQGVWNCRLNSCYKLTSTPIL